MGIYEDIKQNIISEAEALYGSNNSTYGALKAALGDVGNGPNWNTVTISGVEFLVGSSFNPKAVGTNPSDGPETANIDNTVMALILKGVASAFVKSTIPVVASATIISGQIVAYTNGSLLQLAEADGGSRQKNPIGVATNSGAITASVDVHTRPGQNIAISMDSAPAVSSNGELVFLSTTAGTGTLTQPVGLGDRGYVLGVLVGADGVTTKPLVTWMPSIVAL